MFEPAQAKAFELFCRVLGAVAIISGLYLVLWGKSKDQASVKLECDKITPCEQQMAGNGEEFVVVNVTKEDTN